MESPLLFALILCTTTIATAAPGQQIEASENPLPVGSNVTLFSPQDNFTTGAWIFNNNIILLIFNGNPLIFKAWINRITFNSTLSSLTINSVQLEDSGLYTLQGVNSFSSQLELSVQVPIANVTLRANATNLVEFNDTAVLTCSVLNGTSLSYVWLKGSSVVTAGGGVQLSDGGATLTLSGVTHYEEGSYRCNVSNGLNHESSLPVYLNVSYGPSNTTIVLMPMRSTYITGSNITLSCSAESSPPAIIQWMVDGVDRNHFGSQLQLERVTESNSGNYQCVFHNTVTSRFSSNGAMIRILEPIAAVVVNYTGGPVILHEQLSLRCEVNGSVDRIQWYRDHQHITADNTTSFVMNNKTLIISHVQLSDDGNYQCVAFNSVSNMTSSPYIVEIYYGPQMPTIMGPRAAKTGDNATFSCHALSNPSGSYSWFFNNSQVSNMSDYVTPPLNKNMSGKYTCMVFNNITGKNSTAYRMLTVFDLQVESPMHPAIEDHFYKLTCKSGPAEKVYWKKDGQPLREGTTDSYFDNKTLTFNPLKQNDTGLYECIAVNPLWNMTSLPYMLLVNFGPETPMIDGPDFAETGQYAVFTCSAMSMPTSQFSWWFNGSYVANSSVFTTDILSLNMSGDITCMAYNDVTGKNATTSKLFTVIEAKGSVMIRNNTVPINNDNFTLTCDITGPYDSIFWMKDNMYFNMTDSIAEPYMSYKFENNTLHFTPVTLSNEGTYQCVAINLAGEHKSPNYMLLVNYGPLSVNISGPDSTPGDSYVSLTCSADSRPDCDFHWFFNQSSAALKNGSVITFLAAKENEGEYTCKATNPVTNISMYQTKEYTVAAHASALHFPSQGGLMMMMMGLFALSVPVLFH
ncbi:carcinoembryonic antigen-related cell adhesion molecule 1 [Pseudoliparis swirei]|uniref:carcinoembryonic antigen-related cell adhesion molecule 1 n=1 Tax=Pseudoliparis swirei TaxID=2059687 RepID=UPI0024BD7A11|nr:carcinoembryonic antigen-related cell adhesion molecule 1 [Pseudoliparis swirei]